MVLCFLYSDEGYALLFSGLFNSPHKLEQIVEDGAEKPTNLI